jgi:hypothetical protein
MKLLSMNQLINHAFFFVIQNSQKYHIDESHAVKHSMEVFHYANQIFLSETANHPFLEKQKEVIYLSSILHDMCDKKYMNEEEGMIEIQDYIKDSIKEEQLQAVSSIITTMSYSKVMKNGYPQLGDYQLAYHIVREADLLSAYDIDRCIIYQMYHDQCSYDESLLKAIELFDYRVFKYREHDLFVTDYSKKKAKELHEKAFHEIELLKTLFH